MRNTTSLLLTTAVCLSACTDGDSTQRSNESNAQELFWSSLQEICGLAFAGTVVESVPPDTSFAGKAMVMHVRSCDPEQIRIPFFVGDDRSRTWVLTKTPSGLRLKHDHRHEDGTEDAVTMYGGDTDEPGSAARQEFPADDHTAAIVPTAATNVWTLEIYPDSSFAYDLRRGGSDRRFRVEFDLTQPIPEPPPPWGAES